MRINPQFCEAKQIDDSINALVPMAQASRKAALQAHGACVMCLLYQISDDFSNRYSIMAFTPEATLLNELVTPIVITSTDGILLFKNKLARTVIKFAQINSCFFEHLAPEEDMFDKISKIQAKKGVVVRFAEQNNLRAYICEYQSDSESYLVWIFVDCKQFETIFTEMQSSINRYSSQIIKRVIDTSTKKNPVTTNMQFRRYNALISLSKIAYSTYYSDVMLAQSNKSVRRIIDVFEYFSEKVFLNLGYTINIQSQIEQENAIFIDKANIFATGILELCAILLDNVSEKDIKLDIHTGIEGIIFELSGILHPSLEVHAEGKCKLFSVFPKRHLMNLQILEGLAKSYKWDLEANVTNEEDAAKLTIRIIVSKFEDRRNRTLWMKDELRISPFGNGIGEFIEYKDIE